MIVDVVMLFVLWLVIILEGVGLVVLAVGYYGLNRDHRFLRSAVQGQGGAFLNIQRRVGTLEQQRDESRVGIMEEVEERSVRTGDRPTIVVSNSGWMGKR